MTTLPTLPATQLEPDTVVPARAPVVRAAGSRRGSSRLMGRLLSALFVLVLAVFILGPLLWLGIRAFATTWTYPSLTPDAWTMEWWGQVFKDPNLLSSVRLSFQFALTTMLVSAVICLPAAYAFARFDFPGRRMFLVGLFATNAFPKMGLFVALASLFYAFNLMSTFVGVVIVHVLGTVVFMTWIPAAAFAAVPRSPTRRRPGTPGLTGSRCCGR